MCFLTSCPSQQQNNLTNAEADASQFGLSQAKSTLPAATSGLQKPLNFFQALLSGDRNTIMNTLAPSISSLTSQYQTASKTSEEFAPRGGGRAATLQQQPFTEAGQIATMVEGAQKAGAEGVTAIDEELASIGLGELGEGMSGAASTVGQLQTQQQISNQAGAASGQAIGGLVALLAEL